MSIGNISSILDSIPSIRYISGSGIQESRTSEKAEMTALFNEQKPKGLQQDTVELSPEGKKALTEKKSSFNQGISEEERREIEKLKKRDSQVRRHEMSHKMAGGAITGQIVYEYDTGPDGKRYAVGGHISIDTSEESTPEATLRKAASIRRAALAPADPSPADRGVAQRAQSMAAQARQEMAQERQRKMSEQMSEMAAQLSSSNVGVIDVDLEKIFSAKLSNPDDAADSHSVMSLKTSDQIKSAYKANSVEPPQKQIKSESISQDIQIGTSVPSKGRLSEGEERIPEEPAPEVSPVE